MTTRNQAALARAQHAYDHAAPPDDDDECGPCVSCDKKHWCEKFAEARAEARMDEREYERGYR